MDIQFCDLCNESIPVAHLDGGRAFRHAGRLICVTCDQAMGGGGDPDATQRDGTAPRAGQAADQVAGQAPAGDGAKSKGQAGEGSMAEASGLAASGLGASSSGGGIAVGLIALCVSGIGLLLFMERLESSEQELAALDQQWQQRELVQAQERLDQASRLEAQFVAASDQGQAHILGIRDQLQATLQGLAERGEEQGAILSEVRAQVADLSRASNAKGGAVAEQLGALGDRLDAFTVDQTFYSERLSQLDEQLRGVLTMRNVAVAAPASGVDGQSGPRDLPGDPPWTGLLGDLGHDQAGIRMEAVYELAETGDKRVVPHLIPKLSDSDLFVRMATARGLMDLDGRSGVPALIEALGDSSGAVRDAVVVALRRIAGREFGFEPLATQGERAKRIKAWREWWKKAGEAFLAT